MTEFYLPQHVHFCRRGDALIFLNLQKDEYTLVNGYVAMALQARSSTGASNANQDELQLALKEMVTAGLLTMERESGKEVAPTSAEFPMQSLADPEVTLERELGFRDIVKFVAACSAAAFKLRFYKLETTVRSVEKRKANGLPPPVADANGVRVMTKVFLKLRSFFPINYLCLYDSLALIEFLARYKHFPTWIFGVQLEPWAAHCWVQEGHCTLNADIEEAAGYTPIMTV